MTPTPASGPLFGDANCDGRVDLDDVTAVLSGLVGVAPGAPCSDRANVNCNAGLDEEDGLRILAYLAGVPLPQPSGCADVGAPT
jgi:hypothetical protein